MNTPRKVWMVEDTHYDEPGLFWNFEDAERQFMLDTRTGLTSITEFLVAVQDPQSNLYENFQYTEWGKPPGDFWVYVDDGPRIRQVEVQ